MCSACYADSIIIIKPSSGVSFLPLNMRFSLNMEIFLAQWRSVLLSYRNHSMKNQSRKPVPLLLTLNKNSITGKGIIPLARTHDFSKIYPSLPHDTCTYQRGKKCWIFAKFLVDTECMIFNAFNPLLCNVVKWSDTLRVLCVWPFHHIAK